MLKIATQIPPGDNLGNGKQRNRRLDTVRACRLEMASLYQRARDRAMDVTDAKGLAWILSQIAVLIRDGDIEKRLTELEARLSKKHANS